MIEAYKDRSFKPFMDPNFNPADCSYVKLQYSYPLRTFPDPNPGFSDFIYFLGNQLEAFDDASNPSVLPVGYSKYWAQYNRYEVYASAIDVSIFSTDLTNNAVAVLAPMKSTDVNTTQGIFDIAYAKWKVIGPGTGPSICRMRSFMTTSKLYGITAGTDLNLTTTMGSTLGSNPSPILTLWAWTLQFYDVGDNYAKGVNPNASVKLTWYVKFFDRKNVEK